jgi:hypothetical protein
VILSKGGGGGDVLQSELFIGPDSIEVVPKVTNLRFVLNRNLTPEDHYKAVCQRIYSVLRSVKPHARYTPFRVRKKLVVSLVTPHINYGNVVFSTVDSASQSSGVCLSSLSYFCRCFVGDSFEDSPFDVFV